MTRTASPWQHARSIRDLGHATADWLAGQLPSQPGYTRTGPDPETAHLIPTLAACCRAGYVTTNSQPGHLPTRGVDGRIYRQRAAVDGWISDQRLLGRIRSAADRAGMTVIANRPGAPSHPGMPVTEVDGEPVTGFGWSPGHRRLIASVWPGVGHGAARELRAATHLTVVDPVWGRDTVLWPTLAAAL